MKASLAAIIAGAAMVAPASAQQKHEMEELMRLNAYELIVVPTTYLSLISKNAKIDHDTMTVWVIGSDKIKRSTSFNYASGEICEWTDEPNNSKACITGLMNGFKSKHKEALKEFACIAAGKVPTTAQYPSGLKFSPATPVFLQKYCQS